MDQANRLRDLVKLKEPVQSISNNRVITVTSGKGGVGKSNFAVNLAIALSKLDKRVVLIDADFGLSNVEVLLGLIPEYHFGDLLFGNKSVDEVLTTGPMGIKFISGGSGLVEMANISERQMEFIIQNLSYLDKISDIIIIDTGAGISKSVINFIKASIETIIITTPEPTSVTDAYAVIKTIKEDSLNPIHFKLVVNRADDTKEGEEIFRRLDMVSRRFLQTELVSLGSIPYDRLIVKAVKQQSPALMSYPSSDFSRAIETIALDLLNIEHKPQGITSLVKRLSGIFKR